MNWAKQLRKALRATARATEGKSGNVQAPVNIQRAINVNRNGASTTASARQDVEIDQQSE